MPRRPRDEQTILQVARLRYEDGMAQTEVARHLAMSEATVSRYLKQAMELGFIEIRVAPRAFRDYDIERRLVRRFGLAAAVVVEARPSAAATRQLLGGAMARMVDDLLTDHAVIGVSNGDTVAAVAAEARRSRAAQIDVVTLIGGVGRAEEPSHSGRICRTLAERLGGRAWILPIPATVGTAELAETLRQTAAVGEVLSLMRRVSVAVLGIGAMTPGSSTFGHGLFAPEHLDAMVRRHAVGSICARFYDAQGRVLRSDLDARTLSLDLEALLGVPHRMGAAFGPEKRDAIRAAIAGGLINSIGTDARTAEALLDHG